MPPVIDSHFRNNDAFVKASANIRDITGDEWEVKCCANHHFVQEAAFERSKMGIMDFRKQRHTRVHVEILLKHIIM